MDSSFHEPLTLYAWLAGVAPKLGLVTGVIILPQRQAVLVAKQAAQVDLLTGGRFRLGVGIGWNEVEYEALGMDFKNRGRRFVEQIDVMRRLWQEPSVTFKGEYHTVTAAGLNPMPVQRPVPVWIGGSAEAALKRAAEVADGFFPQQPLAGGWGPTLERMREWRRAAGNTHPLGIEARVDGSRGQASDWQATAAGWAELGATHLSINTMNAGFKNVDEHLRRLQEVKEAVQPVVSGS
jgi:probable F420-dependent oxidoreductase